MTSDVIFYTYRFKHISNSQTSDEQALESLIKINK